MAAFSGILTGCVSYLIAAILDGLALPEIVRELLPIIGDGTNIAESQINQTHIIATFFGGLAAATFSMSTLAVGAILLKAFSSRLVGGLGILLGTVAISGYAVGFFVLNISKGFATVAPLSALTFVYLLLVGIIVLRSRHIE